MRALFSCGAIGIAVWLAAACSLQDVDDLKGNPAVADSGAADANGADSGADADADANAEGAVCSQGGAPCDSYQECCSQTCVNGECASCTDEGNVCVVSSDCCGGLTCYAEVCSACAGDGATCSSSSVCCSGICNTGTCKACGTDGESCSASAPCCPGSTCDGGVCKPETCQECIVAKCPDEMTDCLSEQACTDAWSCQQTCMCSGGSVRSCAGQCNGNNNKFLALGACVLNQECGDACTDNVACN